MKYVVVLILLVSCNSKKYSSNKDNIDKKSYQEYLTISKTNNKDNTNTEIIETFTDSLNIGEKGICKIELIKHRVFSDNYVIVKFYTRINKTWYLKNTYSYECNSLMNFEPIISDYNNDKLKDITFISSTAARGANEVRRLFIYNPKENNLTSILNSEDYPNMLYNEELNCIDAWLVHGGSSTVFARIVGDSLISFASVHNDNNRTVYENDKNGKEKLLSRKPLLDKNGIYVRFKNYKPLKMYTY